MDSLNPVPAARKKLSDNGRMYVIAALSLSMADTLIEALKVKHVSKKQRLEVAKFFLPLVAGQI